MNWGQLKDPVYYPCLAGCVVTSWSLTQEVAGSDKLFYKNFVTEFYEFGDISFFYKEDYEFSKNIWGNSIDQSASAEWLLKLHADSDI